MPTAAERRQQRQYKQSLAAYNRQAKLAQQQNKRQQRAYAKQVRSQAGATGINVPADASPAQVAEQARQENERTQRYAAGDWTGDVAGPGGLTSTYTWQNYARDTGVPYSRADLLRGGTPEEYAANRLGLEGQAAKDWYARQFQAAGPQALLDPYGMNAQDLMRQRSQQELLDPYGLNAQDLMRQRSQQELLDPYGMNAQDLMRQRSQQELLDPYGLNARELAAQPTGFEQSPGYQFQLQQGTNAVQQGAAAKGGLISGAAQKELSAYGTGLAKQDYGDWWNRQMGYKQQGLGLLGQEQGREANYRQQGLGLLGQEQGREASYRQQGLGLLGQEQGREANYRQQGLGLLGQEQARDITNRQMNLGGLSTERAYTTDVQNRGLQDFYNQAGLTGQQQRDIYGRLSGVSGAGQEAATNQAQMLSGAGTNLGNMSVGQGSEQSTLAQNRGQIQGDMYAGLGNAANQFVAAGLSMYRRGNIPQTTPRERYPAY